jgi:hypothetical protein
MSVGPSITKIRSLPALSWRERTFVRATHPLLAEWLADADVVSEGAISLVGEVKTYFGTTQVRRPRTLHSETPAPSRCSLTTLTCAS